MKWLILLLLFLSTCAEASGGRRDYLILAFLATVIASVVSVYWVKKTRLFDNIHLKIVGFSVYFWIVMFAQVIVYGLYRFITKN